MESRSDIIRVCIYGGAIGDALGFPVEFLREEHIFQKYGENGITRYTKARFSGKALISDETQMSLLTTNGLLVWEPRTVHRTQDRPRADVMRAMTNDWLKTQESSIQEVRRFLLAAGCVGTLFREGTGHDLSVFSTGWYRI